MTPYTQITRLEVTGEIMVRHYEADGQSLGALFLPGSGPARDETHVLYSGTDHQLNLRVGPAPRLQPRYGLGDEQL